ALRVPRERGGPCAPSRPLAAFPPTPPPPPPPTFRRWNCRRRHCSNPLWQHRRPSLPLLPPTFQWLQRRPTILRLRSNLWLRMLHLTKCESYCDSMLKNLLSSPPTHCDWTNSRLVGAVRTRSTMDTSCRAGSDGVFQALS